MTTVKWAAWFDDVLPDVPGCGQPLATIHIRGAAIDFCKKSLAWRVDMDPLSAIANQGEYDFDLDTGTVLVRVLQVWYQKKPLISTDANTLNDWSAHWPSEVGTPLYWTQENPSDSLILVPMPAAALADAITAKLAVKPSQASTFADARLYEEWRETIASGAKARLFALKKKPWTDPGLATYHKSQFDSKVAEAQLAAAKGFTGKPKRVKAHFF